MLVPSPEVEREVEIDVEAEQEAKLQEMMDREVEYAGPSATDYGEFLLCRNGRARISDR